MTRFGDQGLIAGYYTLSGSMAGAGVGEPSRHTFEERVAAAASAGFTGIGLLSTDYLAQKATGLSDADMLSILTDYGIRVEEMEFLFHWAYDDERGAFSYDLERTLFRMADVFEPHHLSVGDVEPPTELPTFDVVVEKLAGVCDRASEHGLTLAFEFLPWTGIPDAATCWKLIEAVDRPNLGIILDVWHHFRGADDDSQIRAIPTDRIVALALSDATEQVVGDLIEDTTAHRLQPGEGSFDLGRVIRTLENMDWSGPVVAEVLSREQASLPVREAAVRSYDAIKRVLETRSA